MNKYIYIIFFALSIFSIHDVSAQDNEFSEFNDTEEIKKDNSESDEFENTDEFSTIEDDEFSEFSEEETQKYKPKTNWNRFYWAISILFATLLAGIFVRFEATRKIRPIER